MQMQNNLFKKFYVFGVLFLITIFTNLVQATEKTQKVDSSNPYLLISDVADVFFADLKSGQKKFRQNPELLKALVEKDLMTHIDYRYAAYKVLGQALRGSTEEERTHFVDAFRAYLVTTYASIMTLYQDQKVQVESPKTLAENATRANVQVVIQQPKSSPVNIDFKLKKNKKTGQWSPYDMSAEGVSMLTTKQNEWSAILSKKQGIVKLTKKLNVLAKMKIEYKEQ